MGRETCWRVFSYLIIDRQAAQDYLDGMAAKGWALTKIRLGCFAKFRRTDRTDLTYFLDWADPVKMDSADYVQLCADAGWEPVERMDYCGVYVSKPGAKPAPIQTDPALEYQRYRRKVLRRMAIGLGLILTSLTLYALLMDSLGTSSPTLVELLRTTLTVSNAAALLFVTLPLLLAGGAAYFLALTRRLWVWRREAAEGVPLSCHGPRAAKWWGLLRLGGTLFTYLLCLCLPLDALLNHTGSIAWCIGIFIGCGINLYIRGDNPRQRSNALFLMGLAAAVLVCLAISRPLREEWPDDLPHGPVVEGAAMSRFPDRRGVTFLGSRAEWREFVGAGPGYNYDYRLEMEAETWSSPLLADWAFGDMDPDFGVATGPAARTGWSAIDRVGGSYSIRKGSTLLTISYWSPDGEFHLDLLEDAMAWLDQAE